MCRVHTVDREGTRAWIRATGASSGMGTVSGEVAERMPSKRTREDRGCEAWRMSRPGRGDAGGTGWSRQQTPLKPRVEGDGDPLSPGTRLGVGGACWGRWRPGSRGRRRRPARAKPPAGRMPGEEEARGLVERQEQQEETM